MPTILRFTILLFALAFNHGAIADVAQLLRNNRISELEAVLADVQKRFENGELTEFDLRDTYRPFYVLDEISVRNLTQWASSSPKSYAAHLALGVYFKRRGTDARGDKYIADTEKIALEKMTTYHNRAMEEFRVSFALTEKPYLSVFHMLTISMQFGDRKTSLEMLHLGNRFLPTNSLVRNRFAASLTPRWGGSREQLAKFISDTKSEQVPSSIIYQLEAIDHDDRGHDLIEQNHRADAMLHFRKALELGDRVGGTFAVDFLTTSRYYVCPEKAAFRSCR